MELPDIKIRRLNTEDDSPSPKLKHMQSSPVVLNRASLNRERLSTERIINPRPMSLEPGLPTIDSENCPTERSDTLLIKKETAPFD